MPVILALLIWTAGATAAELPEPADCDLRCQEQIVPCAQDGCAPAEGE